MQKYKRLLDKVTKKIDKWHDEKDGRNIEKFEKDSDYIEAERSPGNFSSSDEGGLEEGKNQFESPGGNIKAQFRTAASEHGSPANLRIKPSSGFKLSIMDTVPVK